jgi:hypothetical protein
VLRRLFGCLLLAFVTLFVRPAFAETQEQQAAALEKEGREAFSAGEFAAAAEKFDAANRLAPHAQLRYNAALAWEKAREFPRAADAYEAALRQGGLQGALEKKAESALAGLKENLGYVKVPRPVSGTLSVAHLSQAPIPAQFHLTPGQYTIQIESASGVKTEKPVSVKAGEVVTVEVEAESAEPGAALPQREAGDDPTTPPPDDRAPAAGSGKKTWGWILVGTGVVLGGVSAYFGTQTTKAKSDFEDSGFTDADARDRGLRNRTITNVALAGAVLGVGVGGYLLLSGTGKSSATRGPRVGLVVRGSGVDARFDF